MPLPPGTRLGPYEVVAKLGEGGMGEVYRARDLRLERTVAIKVLPQLVRDDPERRERFEREARAVAALNHPNICTLHDIGHDSGLDFLVMELVEGETLQKRLERGAMPLDQALRTAAELASALDRAHRHGIVHRDVKPGNVILTKTGAKLLDFGLAKLRAPVASNETTLATQRADVTAHGTILGTIQYMAPEQLEGDEADARSDIFALGAVLFEMVTGRKAFEGKGQASVIAAILSSTPPGLRKLQPLAPASLERIVQSCLAKDPDERWQAAGDLARELQWIAGQPASSVTPEHSMQRPLVLAAAGFVAGGLIVGALLWSLRTVPRSATPSAMHLQVDLAPAEALLGAQPGELTGARRPSRTAIALSPDGRFLVFAGVRGKTQQLFLQSLSGHEATPIPGTEGADTPFFSPDGRWIGFWGAEKLRKVPVDGGPVVDLCDTPTIRAAHWGPNDTIVFAQGGIKRVSAAGGSVTPVTTLSTARLESQHSTPFVLPGGRALLYTAIHSSVASDTSVLVRWLDTGNEEVLLENAADARYVPTGHIVFARTGTLVAAPFDLGTLKITGGQVGILDSVMQSLNATNTDRMTGAAQFTFSDTGHLAYVSGGIYRDDANQLVWLDRAGNRTTLPAPTMPYQTVRLSPDERQVAARTSGLDSALVIYDPTRGGVPSRLRFDGRPTFFIWTRDGKSIVFSGSASGPASLYVIAADGGTPAERLTTSEFTQYPSSWSADGNDLIFVENHPETRQNVMALSMRDRRIRPLLAERFREQFPEMSPDGQWLAYASDESGELEVYVRPYPALDKRIRVSLNGGNSPLWTRGGSELIYRESIGPESGRVMSVDTTRLAQGVSGQPRMLFETTYAELGSGTPVRAFDITRDGMRIFGRTSRPQTPPPPATINVIVNWLSELRAKVPVK